MQGGADKETTILQKNQPGLQRRQACGTQQPMVVAPRAVGMDRDSSLRRMWIAGPQPLRNVGLL